MLSAIYLDPRFSFELTAEQKQTTAHISKVQSRILGILFLKKSTGIDYFLYFEF